MACLVLGALLWRAVQRRRQAVYLLGFACFKPPEHLKVPLQKFMKGSRQAQVHSSFAAAAHVKIVLVPLQAGHYRVP